MTNHDTSPEIYEFALKVLTDRQSLDDAQVEEWLAVPENVRALEELARLRSTGYNNDIFMHRAADKQRLLSRLKRPRNVRRLAAASVAAALLLAVVTLFPEKPVPAGNTVSGAVELVLPDGRVIDIGAEERQPDEIPNYAIKPDALVQVADAATDGPQTPDYLHTLKIGTGRFFRVVLSDSTVVWLNSESEIHYPGHFGADERRVRLSGEAYFEVAHDPGKPFSIDFDGGSVTVLGTKFNVSAYANDPQVFTTLAEGSVKVTTTGGEETLLLPDQQCVLEKSSGTVRVEAVDAADYKAWVDGRFVFRSKPMADIMRQLQRWYGVEVEYADDTIMDYQFYGAFMRTSDLGNLLRAIELAVGVETRWSDNKIVIEKRRK